MMNNLARKTAFEDCAEFIKFRHHLLDFFACDDRDEVKFALGWFDACYVQGSILDFIFERNLRRIVKYLIFIVEPSGTSTKTILCPNQHNLTTQRISLRHHLATKTYRLYTSRANSFN